MEDNGNIDISKGQMRHIVWDNRQVGFSDVCGTTSESKQTSKFVR